MVKMINFILYIILAGVCFHQIAIKEEQEKIINKQKEIIEEQTEIIETIKEQTIAYESLLGGDFSWN